MTKHTDFTPMTYIETERRPSQPTKLDHILQDRMDDFLAMRLTAIQQSNRKVSRHLCAQLSKALSRRDTP